VRLRVAALILGIAILASPLGAEAQNRPRIGLLSIGADPSRPVAWLPFLERLRDREMDMRFCLEKAEAERGQIV
jgi:hypothetical protein